MKVRMLEDYGVTAEAKPWLAKDTEVEIDRDLALQLMSGNRAVLIGEANQMFAAPEKATIKTPETRNKRKRGEVGESKSREKRSS